ncbi:MAG: hypothetical protein BGO29_00945 [Bacteroidales bacterium 36-12]|mgnify:CR=1 FL=1|nr:MAG: hypothetical protein BGO29_00945 [Bacteroidales bacterium 36-12]
MKADVQYNDFVGTSAADISDFSHLNDFLSARGVDTSRYDSIGARFYAGYSHSFSASIICVDKETSTPNNPYIVTIRFENKFEKDEFFDLFKRFNVVILKKYGGYKDREIDEDIVFDDREI